jgi:hypothetical protein
VKIVVFSEPARKFARFPANIWETARVGLVCRNLIAKERGPMTGIRTLGNAANHRGGCELVRKKAPRLVLGLGVSGLAVAVEAHFRRLGWEVTHAGCGTDVSQYVHRHRATAVVLPYNCATESGLLTCAKLSLTRPQARVVFLGPEDEQLMQFARLAGAAGYLPEGAGVAAVARAVLGN